MGFGFGVPGIRISTRGVRVGPRWASVSAGRGGVRATAGPRLARVSVGSRGVGVSSGIGPLTVGSGGARLSGGIGPVSASVGSRGAGAALGAGPFWLGGNASRFVRPKLGRQGRGSSRSSVGSSAPQQLNRVSLTDHYESYQSALRSAGVKRRNTVEMAAAGVQAVMFELAAMAAWAQPFGRVQAPVIPQVPSAAEIAAHVKQDMRSAGEWKRWRKQSKETLAQRSSDLKSQIEAQRQALYVACAEAYKRFEELQPAVTTLVMQAILSDNGVPASPVGIDNGDVLVLMTFPEEQNLIWPEEANFDALPKISVKKRTKANQSKLYKQILFRFLLATGKEVLAAHYGIRSVRIVAVDGAHTGSLATQPVRGELTIDRSDLTQLKTDDRFAQRFEQVSQTWDSHNSTMDLHEVTRLFAEASDLWLSLRQAESDQLAELAARVRGYETKSGKLSDMGQLQHLFPTVDFEALEAREDAHKADQDIAITQLSVEEPGFWADALELADNWS
jgi:hypothetical protein